MIQALLIKTIVNKVIGFIEKADDDKLSKNHAKRIKALEKIAHEPSDWVCLTCGCNAKKVEKVTRKRRK